MRKASRAVCLLYLHDTLLAHGHKSTALCIISSSIHPSNLSLHLNFQTHNDNPNPNHTALSLATRLLHPPFDNRSPHRRHATRFPLPGWLSLHARLLPIPLRASSPADRLTPLCLPARRLPCCSYTRRPRCQSSNSEQQRGPSEPREWR
jgi:hypothetical protein